jgi:hypothetical protein
VATFGGQGNAELDDLVRGDTGDVLAGEDD